MLRHARPRSSIRLPNSCILYPVRRSSAEQPQQSGRMTGRATSLERVQRSLLKMFVCISRGRILISTYCCLTAALLPFTMGRHRGWTQLREETACVHDSRSMKANLRGYAHAFNEVKK